MNNFVKAVFLYLKNGSPRISDTKIREGIYTGPQITELIKDHGLEGCLNGVEKSA